MYILTCSLPQWEGLPQLPPEILRHQPQKRPLRHPSQKHLLDHLGNKLLILSKIMDSASSPRKQPLLKQDNE